MAFVDELTFEMHAGKGGDGVVRWLHIKGKDLAGPAGGNGGRGGHIYVEGVRDLSVLSQYKSVKEFKAEHGGDGAARSRQGREGKDLVIALPVGSVVTQLETGFTVELLKEGEKKLLLSGGRGGLGNEHFKSSTNRSPSKSTAGALGESGTFRVEVNLIADGGFIGLPNAGKSSLLNALTKAKAKVGEYQFTTLEPNLGELYGFILADIPGLIEGASEGKGLGHKFLKHIKRTRVLFHCIAADTEDLKKTYSIVHKELKAFSPTLVEKPEIILITKSDLVDEKQLKKQVTAARKLADQVRTVTILDDASIKELQDAIIGIFRAV
jgi:GTP-binding protein